MANNKNSGMTEEERKRLQQLEEFAAQQSEQKNKVNIVTSAPTAAQAKANMPDYITTGPVPPPAIAATQKVVTAPMAKDTTSTLNAESALKRYLSKMPGAVLAPDADPDGISPDALSGASPSTGEAVRRNEPSSPHGSYEEVGADYAANAPYGGIRYADGFFVYKDGNGGYYTEAYGKKTPSDIYGHPLTAPTTKKEQSAGAASDGKETISQAPTVDYDHYYDYAPAGTGASDENTRRTLDEIYNEYLEGAYYKNAVAEGKRLAEDVLGKYAAMTGGMPSTAATYAATAAGQQSDRAAQDYLWELAQKQFQTEKDEQAAESEKYASMIDNYLKMGYGVGDIPDEWWAKSNYDKKFAGGVSEYVGRQNAANASGDEREFYSALLDKYVSGGYDVPDELYARAGYSDEQAAMLKNYVASLGAKNGDETPVKTQGVNTENYKTYSEYTKAVLDLYTNGSGDGWYDYLNSIDDASIRNYLVNYLKANVKMSERKYEYDASTKTFTDDFGDEYSESELKDALNEEKKTNKNLDVNNFIKKLKK